MTASSMRPHRKGANVAGVPHWWFVSTPPRISGRDAKSAASPVGGVFSV